jgi:hypothetical protein
MSEPNEANLVAGGVDIHNWGPTEPNEDDILESLGYVLNPATGIYEDRP